jgi:hypothetical protein
MKGISIAVTAKGRAALYTQSTEEYFQSLVAVSNYMLCKTRSGYVGFVPLSGVVVDPICVLLPFLGGRFLRSARERRALWNVQGDRRLGCYIHGMMKGEALGFPQWSEQDISLH